MIDFLNVEQILGAAIGIVTVTVQFLSGSEKTSAWYVALAGNVLWFIFVIVTGIWTLLPMVLAMTVVYIRNLIKWTKRDQLRKNT